MILTSELVQRVERNDALSLVEYAQIIARLEVVPHARALPVADGYAIFAGHGSPINRVIGLGLAQTITAADLDQVEQFYAAIGVPAQIDVCPLANPSLIEHLGQRGYVISGFMSVHVRPLAVENIQEPRQEGVIVTEVDQHDAERWIDTVVRGFANRSDLPTDDWTVRLARVAANRSSSRCFLATIDGVAVGAGALTIGDGLATLFSTSVCSEFRRRGVQTALLHARLHAAAEAGCDLAMVATIPGSASQRNVMRAGFQVAYTKPTVLRSC